MKLVEVKYGGHKLAFFAQEEVAQYIDQAEDNFLHDPEERAFFEALFPGQLEYVLTQIQSQIRWQSMSGHKL